MDPLTDPRSLGTEELKLVIQELISRKQKVSHTRQALHAQIDALRGELVDRLRNEGKDVIFGPDTLGPGTSGVREPMAQRTSRRQIRPTRSGAASSQIRNAHRTVGDVPRRVLAFGQPEDRMIRRDPAQLLIR
jgi:hypothetical protein